MAAKKNPAGDRRGCVPSFVFFVRFGVLFALRAARPARDDTPVVMVMHVMDEASHDCPKG
jgi:hypothetical protein